MDPDTRGVYEVRAEEWVSRRTADHDATHAARFVARCGDGLILDAGCGTGWHTDALASSGHNVVSMDGAFSMLRLRDTEKCPRPVQGFLQDMPFANEAFVGVWANMSYLHVPRAEMAAAFVELARVLKPGGFAEVSVYAGSHDGAGFEKDDLGDRWYMACEQDDIREWGSAALLKLEVVVSASPVLRVVLRRV